MAFRVGSFRRERNQQTVAVRNEFAIAGAMRASPAWLDLSPATLTRMSVGRNAMPSVMAGGGGTIVTAPTPAHDFLKHPGTRPISSPRRVSYLPSNGMVEHLRSGVAVSLAAPEALSPGRNLSRVARAPLTTINRPRSRHHDSEVKR